MVLRRTGTKFVGKYVYEKHPSPVELEGTSTPSGDIELEESVNGKVTGHFRGHMDDHQFVGQWKDPSEKRTLPFKLDIARGRMVLLRERRVHWKSYGKSELCENEKSVNSLCTEDGRVECTMEANLFEVLDGLGRPHVAALNKLLRPKDIDDRSCTEDSQARTEIRSELHVDDGGVLSVVMDSSWDCFCAYPDSSKLYVNYWLDEGRSFTLKDALTPAAAALFAKHAESEDLSGDPVLSSTLSFDNKEFAIEREGIRFFGFNAMNHANKAIAPEVFVSFKELRGAIKNPGPLAKLAAAW